MYSLGYIHYKYDNYLQSGLSPIDESPEKASYSGPKVSASDFDACKKKINETILTATSSSSKTIHRAEKETANQLQSFFYGSHGDDGFLAAIYTDERGSNNRDSIGRQWLENFANAGVSRSDYRLYNQYYKLFIDSFTSTNPNASGSVRYQLDTKTLYEDISNTIDQLERIGLGGFRVYVNNVNNVLRRIQMIWNIMASTIADAQKANRDPKTWSSQLKKFQEDLNAQGEIVAQNFGTIKGVLARAISHSSSSDGSVNGMFRHYTTGQLQTLYKQLSDIQEIFLSKHSLGQWAQTLNDVNYLANSGVQTGILLECGQITNRMFQRMGVDIKNLSVAYTRKKIAKSFQFLCEYKNTKVDAGSHLKFTGIDIEKSVLSENITYKNDKISAAEKADSLNFVANVPFNMINEESSGISDKNYSIGLSKIMSQLSSSIRGGSLQEVMEDLLEQSSLKGVNGTPMDTLASYVEQLVPHFMGHLFNRACLVKDRNNRGTASKSDYEDAVSTFRDILLRIAIGGYRISAAVGGEQRLSTGSKYGDADWLIINDNKDHRIYVLNIPCLLEDISVYLNTTHSTEKYVSFNDHASVKSLIPTQSRDEESALERNLAIWQNFSQQHLNLSIDATNLALYIINHQS